MDKNDIKYNTPLTEYLYAKAGSMRLPLSGTFELTPQCNLECRMCYVRKTAQEVAMHSRNAMSLEDWLALAEEAKKRGMLYLLLTGGEPFLWPDFWELYEKLIEMGFLVSINSNGTLINEEVVTRLKKKPPMRINVTLYGASDETYKALCGRDNMFDRVDTAISLLKDAGILVKLNCSLTPQNVGDLEAINNYAKERNLVLSVATYMFPPVRRDESMVGQNDRFTPQEAAKYRIEDIRLQNDEEYFKGYLQSIVNGIVPPPGLDESCVDPVDGKVRCRAGKACFWITWDRYMTPCGMMQEPKVDLTELSFSSAWEKLCVVTDDMRLSGTCQECSNQKVCHACAAMAMAETGRTDGIPKYLCEQTLAMQSIARQELEKLGIPLEE